MTLVANTIIGILFMEAYLCNISNSDHEHTSSSNKQSFKLHELKVHAEI